MNDSVYVYIGPSIRGVIRTGSIYRGTRAEVLTSLAAARERYPQIERLVVADSELASAKQKIRVGGNSLSHAYRVLADTK